MGMTGDQTQGPNMDGHRGWQPDRLADSICQEAVPGGSLTVASWEGVKPAVAFLHGFTLRGTSFAHVASGHKALAPDLPGHGSTKITPITLNSTLVALAAWLKSCRPALLAGYSMGGRIALHLGFMYPKLVPRLLLISTGLGIVDPHARVVRANSDARLAMAIEQGGVKRFIDDWINHPIAGTGRMKAPLREVDRAGRIGHDPLLLAAALRALGPASHTPLHNRLGNLDIPTTWMAGSLDPEYATIARTSAATSSGKAIVVPDAGHNLVLEAPDAVGAVVDRLLRVR